MDHIRIVILCSLIFAVTEVTDTSCINGRGDIGKTFDIPCFNTALTAVLENGESEDALKQILSKENLNNVELDIKNLTNNVLRSLSNPNYSRINEVNANFQNSETQDYINQFKQALEEFINDANSNSATPTTPKIDISSVTSDSANVLEVKAGLREIDLNIELVKTIGEEEKEKLFGIATNVDDNFWNFELKGNFLTVFDFTQKEEASDMEVYGNKIRISNIDSNETHVRLAVIDSTYFNDVLKPLKQSEDGWVVVTNLLTLTTNGKLSMHVDFMLKSDNHDENDLYCISIEKNGETLKYEGKPTVNNGLATCVYNHTTSFAILFNPTLHDTKGFDENNPISYLVVIGISLSSIAIIISAIIFFKDFRVHVKSTFQVVLLNLEISMMLLYIIFIFGLVYPHNKTYLECSIIGMLLHYAILVQFMWMLTETFVHYLKFSKVLGISTNNLILKAMITNWGLPFIISLLIVLIDKSLYYTNGKCIISELALYLGLITPVAVIILINSVLFGFVFSSLRKAKNISKVNSIENKILFFLFIISGIPWIVIFFVKFDKSKTLDYIFNIFICPQGLLLLILNTCNRPANNSKLFRTEK